MQNFKQCINGNTVVISGTNCVLRWTTHARWTNTQKVALRGIVLGRAGSMYNQVYIVHIR